MTQNFKDSLSDMVNLLYHLLYIDSSDMLRGLTMYGGLADCDTFAQNSHVF